LPGEKNNAIYVKGYSIYRIRLSGKSMTVHIDSGDDIVIPIETGLLSEKIRLLEEKFDFILNCQEKNVTLDMSGVSHLDSLLLSVLIRFRSRLYVCGRSLRLVNCNEKIIDIIRRSALEDYFLD
jgi:anti-anti-sigma factor